MLSRPSRVTEVSGIRSHLRFLSTRSDPGADGLPVPRWHWWGTGDRHPGRGRYLIKTGQRVGIPVELEFVADEAWLYDTDSAVRPTAGGSGRAS